jgi:hypothetical protein
MGKYLFQSGSVYWQKEGQFGVMSKEDFAKDTSSKDISAQVLINNVDFKTLLLSDVNTHLADELVAAEFSADQVVQSEKINSALYQGMAISKDQVTETYSLFNKDAIKVFIPYPIALRAFISQKKLLNELKISIVVDDLQDRLILTIFWGMKVIETREIQKKATAKIAEEVVRSEKNFIINHIKEISSPSFMFISNNKELCEALANIEGHKAENMVYFDERYPAFLALDFAKFNVHFHLADEILKQRRLKEFKRNLLSYSVAGSMVGLTLIYFLVAVFGEHMAMDENIKLNANRAALVEKIKSGNALVYQDILKEREKMDLFSLYGNFVENVPPGYLIQNFSLVLDNESDLSGEWTFTGLITSDKSLVSQFGSKGMFKNRTVDNILLKDSPAQRVVLTVAKSKGE